MSVMSEGIMSEGVMSEGVLGACCVSRTMKGNISSYLPLLPSPLPYHVR